MSKAKYYLLFVILLFSSIFCIRIISSTSDEKIVSPLFQEYNYDNKKSSGNRFNEYFTSEEFGNQVDFWISLPGGMAQMRSTLLAIGNWSYIYMANETIDYIGQNSSIAKCTFLCTEFDETIYPKAIEVAGDPNGYLGDIDGDSHITVFLAPLCRHYGDNSVLGYYDVINDYVGITYSNTREMIYVDSEHSYIDTQWITTHELNHLFWGNYEFDEAEFLTEGLANYNVDYDGYYSWVTDAITTTYTYHPEMSLLYFVREYGDLWDSSYGQAYLFVTYLADRFGNEFTKKLVSIAADGAKAIDVALNYFDYDLKFNDVYLDWITAGTIDDISFADGIYGFKNVDYRIQAQRPIGYYFPLEKHDIIHYYYGFEVKAIYTDYDSFTFIIENPYPYSLGISVIIKDDNGWNVTQYINNEQSDLISIFIEGTNIQDAYILTSLMSSETPSNFGVVYSMSEIPSELLDYYFYEGKYENTTENRMSFIPIISVVCVFLIFRLKRKLFH